jgi:hypothetical protein
VAATGCSTLLMSAPYPVRYLSACIHYLLYLTSVAGSDGPVRWEAGCRELVLERVGMGLYRLYGDGHGVILWMQAYPDNPVQCTASACQFKEGSSKVQCKTAQCACPQGACPDIAAAYINQIQGKEITADCDEASGNCNISIQDFPIQLQTPCKSGDCLSEKNPTLNSGELGSIHAWKPPKHVTF